MFCKQSFPVSFLYPNSRNTLIGCLFFLIPGWHFTHCTWVYCPIIKEFRMTLEKRTKFQRFSHLRRNYPRVLGLFFVCLFLQTVPNFYLGPLLYLVQNSAVKQFPLMALPFSFSQRLQVLNEIPGYKNQGEGVGWHFFHCCLFWGLCLFIIFLSRLV